MRGLTRAGICAVVLATPIAAQGADLVAIPAPVAQAPLSWAGFYAGVHLASGWANPTWQSATGFGGAVPFPGGASGNGAVGGGQVGWNYQTGPWVLGVEAAFAAAVCCDGVRRGCFHLYRQCGCARNGDRPARLCVRSVSALRQSRRAAVEHSRDAMVLRPFTAFSINGSPTRSGWTAGTGVEFRLQSRAFGVCRI